MENTNTKVEVMKPVFIKAGIPLAITVAGFIISRFTTRKCSVLNASLAENQVNSPEADSHMMHRDEGSSHSLELLDSSSLSCLEDSHSSRDTSQRNLEEELHCQSTFEVEEELLGLRSQVKQLQQREVELEMQYLGYHDLKEQELVLMELQNKLLLEIARVEFLDREISSVEAERRRFDDMVIEYLKIMELLESSRSENKLLQRRVKKLLRRSKRSSRVIKEHFVRIEAKDAEISSNHEELKIKANAIKKMEDEIEELKTAMDQLQLENNELLNQIEQAKKATAVKIGLEEATKADYSRVICELEQLEKERAVEVKELIYLRWCNACLRHELMRRNQEQQDQQVHKDQLDLNFGEIAEFGSENEVESSTLDQGDSCLGFSTGHHAHAHPKKHKFMVKFKRWMEGSEKIKHKFNEKEKHKHFCRHPMLDGAYDLHIPARKSSFSA